MANLNGAGKNSWLDEEIAGLDSLDLEYNTKLKGHISPFLCDGPIGDVCLGSLFQLSALQCEDWPHERHGNKSGRVSMQLRKLSAFCDITEGGV